MLRNIQTCVPWKPAFTHSCKKVNEKLKCRTNIQEEPKYRYEKGNEYPDIETIEIEIQESLKKRKGSIIFSREKERTR